jgi:ribonuclease J
MWKGYQEDKDMKSFLEFIQNLGVKIHTLHTSGHADTETVEKLIADVKPKVIMPVHTENEQWFDNYKNEINVVYQNNCIDL